MMVPCSRPGFHALCSAFWPSRMSNTSCFTLWNGCSAMYLRAAARVQHGRQHVGVKTSANVCSCKGQRK
jgi:hypothetical protein